MAPALTEPLSPNEKLSKTNVTTVPLTRTTRRSRAAAATDTDTVLKATSSRDRKSRASTGSANTTTTTTNTSTTTTTTATSTTVSTTRVTRSKDNANQRLSEQAAIPAESNNQAKSSVKIQKEPMGLSAALNNNNNNSNNNNSSNIAQTSTSENKSDNTQLLTDIISINIEEAISAEICLRKQLLEGNLSQEAAKKTNGTEIKEIFVIKDSVSGGVVDTTVLANVVQEEQQQQMDPVLKNIDKDLDEISKKSPAIDEAKQTIDINAAETETEQEAEAKKTPVIAAINDEIETQSSATIIESAEIEVAKVVNEDVQPTVQQQTDHNSSDVVQNKAEEEEQAYQQQVQEKDEKQEQQEEKCTENDNENEKSKELLPCNEAEDMLPATEYAMPASEHEDNLEARLSQLDGHVLSTTIGHNNELALETTTTTIMQEDFQDLQEQLQLSPTITATDIEAPASIATTTTTTTTESQEQEYEMEFEQEPEPEPEPETPQEGEELILELEQEHDSTNTTNMQQTTNAAVAVHAEFADQDIEEVLKVLKTLDPIVNADTICDLNALFGDAVYSSINYDDVNVATEQDIDEQVEDVVDEPTCMSPVQMNDLQYEQLQLEKSQQVIQNKLDFLLQRLRKLQVRHMCKHASEEIAGVLEYAVRDAAIKERGAIGVGADNNSYMNVDTEGNSKEVYGLSVISARPPPHIWEEERQKLVTASMASNFFHKLENAAQAQQLCTAYNTATTTTLTNTIGNQQARKSRKRTLSIDTANSTIATKITELPPQQLLNETSLETTTTINTAVVPPFNDMVREEMRQVVGMLHSELRDVQQGIDSDATESSSGCDSADEMISYNNQIQEPLDL